MAAYVLVHGAWHGGWCWGKVTRLLREKGHEVRALDMPGHGDDPGPVPEERPLDAYVSRVCEQIAALSEPALLVGHSLGGTVISMAAEREPQRVRRLFYVTAYLFKSGQSVSEFVRADPTYSRTHVSPSADGKRVTIAPEALQKMLYHDCPAGDMALARSRLVAEPAGAFTQRVKVTPERWGRIPRTYVECLEDRAIPISQQRSMQAALPCERVVSLPCAHSPFFAMPEALVEAIAA